VSEKGRWRIRITHKMYAADDVDEREGKSEKINRIYMANKCFKLFKILVQYELILNKCGKI
jgi:hypothetical protein